MYFLRLLFWIKWNKCNKKTSSNNIWNTYFHYHYYYYPSFFIAFACNKNALQLPFLFFLFLVPSTVGQTAKHFLVNILRLISLKACDKYLTHLDTPKYISVKIVTKVVIYDACGTWYSLFMVTSIHSIQKTARNSQKFWNKLAS